MAMGSWGHFPSPTRQPGAKALRLSCAGHEKAEIHLLEIAMEGKRQASDPRAEKEKPNHAEVCMLPSS